MRFVIGVVLLILLPGVAAAFVASFVLFLGVSSLVIPVAVGAFAGILLDHFVFHRFPLVETFEHEFTHAVVALIFFRRITGFTVRKRGGTVSHQGGFGGRFGTDCIGLAPYVLPTFTVFSILARPFVPATWFPWFDGWIGLTFGYHLWSALEEIRDSWTTKRFVSVGTGEVTQTDIARRGFMFSAIFIATFSLAIHGLLLAILTGGKHGAVNWASETRNVTIVVLTHMGTWLKEIGAALWRAIKA